MDSELAERHRANLQEITFSIRNLAKEAPELVPELAYVLAELGRKLLTEQIPGYDREVPIEEVTEELYRAYLRHLRKMNARAKAARAATGTTTVERHNGRRTRGTGRISR